MKVGDSCTTDWLAIPCATTSTDGSAVQFPGTTPGKMGYRYRHIQVQVHAINLHVCLLVFWLIGWTVCHNFLKGQGSYTSMCNSPIVAPVSQGIFFISCKSKSKLILCISILQFYNFLKGQVSYTSICNAPIGALVTLSIFLFPVNPNPS